MKPDLYIRAAGSYDPRPAPSPRRSPPAAPAPCATRAGPFMEIIDLSGFDPAALVGKPVFLDHRHTTDAAVGVVIDARREGGAIVGEVQLSAAESVADVRTKVAEGVIGAVSIGYHVRRWTEGRDASGRRTKTAAAGELVELSLVGLPADPAATIRSDGMEPTPEQTPEPQPAPAPQPIIRAHVAPTGSEDPAAAYALREEALFCRMAGAEPSAGARQFMGFGFAELAL